MRKMILHQYDRETDAHRMIAEVDITDIGGIPTIEEALEWMYEHTQNVTDSWSRPNPVKDYCDGSHAIKVLAEYPKSEMTGKVMGHRSTMGGDRIEVINGKYRDVYEIRFVGFKKIDV